MMVASVTNSIMSLRIECFLIGGAVVSTAPLLMVGAVVSARLCRLPEQEVHQFINNTYFLGGAVVSLLVQLRQLHPLIIAHTS